MASRGRIALHLNKSIPTASETELGAIVHFERVWLDSRAVRYRGALAAEHVASHLEATGAVIEANVDGSVTSVPFVFKVAADKHAAVTELVVTMAGNPIDSFWSGFGDLGVLANGITAVVDDGAATPTALLDLTGGAPWKRTADLVSLADRVHVQNSGGGADVVVVRMRLGDGLYLSAGHRIVVTVRDNLTGLDALRFRALGVQRASDAV